LNDYIDSMPVARLRASFAGRRASRLAGDADPAALLRRRIPAVGV
jgi:hypothetical protein